MRVFVYYNLHKKLWSIKHIKTGKVIGHCREVYLQDCIFKISEAGRQRVLREKRKNVHAGVVGTWDYRQIEVFDGDPVTYNPYKYSSFIYRKDLSPISKADEVYMYAPQNKSPNIFVKNVDSVKILAV